MAEISHSISLMSQRSLMETQNQVCQAFNLCHFQRWQTRVCTGSCSLVWNELKIDKKRAVIDKMLKFCLQGWTGKQKKKQKWKRNVENEPWKHLLMREIQNAADLDFLSFTVSRSQLKKCSSTSFTFFPFFHSFIPGSFHHSGSQYPVSCWLCNSQGPKWELKHSSDSGHCSYLKNWKWQKPIKIFLERAQKCTRRIVATDLYGNLSCDGKLHMECYYQFEWRWRFWELCTRKLFFTVT